MKGQFPQSQKTKIFNNYSTSIQNDCRQRRLQEMRRRFAGLNSRRLQLERELKAVENCLLSLDKQLQCYASFEQLSIGD